MANKRLMIARLCFTSGSLVIALVLAACAGLDVGPSRLPPLTQQSSFQVPDLDVRAVSPEMDAFLDRYVGAADNLDNRAWSMVWAVTDRGILPFTYDPSLTLTSVEAFARKKGNCLAFANMLVAMARSRGLHAWYQEVEIPPQWSSFNSTVLISLHVNVVLKGRYDEWVVDILGEGTSASRKIRRISDREALAQQYNNLGANELIDEHLGKAYAFYSKAIETAPDLPYLWSNIGVVYSRNGQTEDARQAYLHALKIDPGNANAANNLYMIYEKEGNLAAAERLQRQVERHRRKNPYYLYFLSSQAAEQGNYEESTAMLEKAIRMNENEYRFYYELARLQVIQGDLKDAKVNLHRALELAPDGSPISGASIDNLPDLPE